MAKEDVRKQAPTGTTPDRPTALDPTAAKASTDRAARFSDPADYVAKITRSLKESASSQGAQVTGGWWQAFCDL